MVTGERWRFPKSHRLLKRQDYQRVFNHGKRHSHGGFTVLALRNQLPHPRLGLVVSKRCGRRSVDRQRLKRLVRESFRLQQDTLGGLDIVVIGRSDALHRSNEELFASLSRHWRKLSSCVC
ncbi:MAG TPA: ribonuclease P protein component [Gammaproteobacteria bacterium]|nr:ribonuclease P protein component [Gammaproteobacteria bacterium]